MASYKQAILFLLTIVWLLERVLSHENLSHHNLSGRNHEFHIHDEDFDLFTAVHVENQSKNLNATKNPGYERKSHLASQTEKIEDNPDANSTDNEQLARNSSINGTKSTEDAWDFSKIFEYFLSFIYKLDPEESNETSETSNEIKKDSQRSTFSKNQFSTSNEECRTDSCDSIKRKEDHYRSVGENPDVDFDSDDKIIGESTQNPQKISEETKQDEEGVSETKLKSINKSEEHSQSVDSNPDVAFDKNDELERRASLEGENDPEMTRKDEENISENNPASQLGSADPIQKTDHNSDFVFSGERNDDGEPQETQMDEKSLSGNTAKKQFEVPESTYYSSSDNENEDSEDELDSTKENESHRTQEDQIKGNNFMPHENELYDEEKEPKDGSSDVKGKERMTNSKENSESKANSNILLNSSEENKQSPEENKRSSVENNSSSEENNSSSEENKRSSVENKSSSEENKRSSEENKRSSEENISSSEENKKSSEKNKNSEENKRSSEKNKRSSEENKRSSEENKRNSEENKSSSEENKKCSEKNKKSSEENKRNSEENKKSSEENKRSSEENKRNPGENKRSSEESSVKPKLNPELLSENSTETLTKHKTYNIETKPKDGGEKEYYEDDNIDEDEYEDENEYKNENEDEGEYREENEDDLDVMYFDDFVNEDGNYYYDENSESIFQDFVPPQTSDDVMGSPQVITDEPYEETDYNYSNAHKPLEPFNTILEYLYKYSNNPLFMSLNQENSTEAENRTT